MSCLNCGNVVFLGAFCEKCRDDNHRECKKKTRKELDKLIEDVNQQDQDIVKLDKMQKDQYEF